MNSIRSKDILSTKIGCSVLFFILVIFWGIQTVKTETSVTATVTPPTPLITISLTPTLDPKVVLYESIDQALGTDDRNLPRLIKISYSKPEAGDITIIWTIHRNAFQNPTKADAQNDAANILKALDTNKTRFIYVVLIGTVWVQNKDGNTVEIQALNLGFNKSKLDKINWEDFQPSDVYGLADVAYIADDWK